MIWVILTLRASVNCGLLPDFRKVPLCGGMDMVISRRRDVNWPPKIVRFDPARLFRVGFSDVAGQTKKPQLTDTFRVNITKVIARNSPRTNKSASLNIGPLGSVPPCEATADI